MQYSAAERKEAAVQLHKLRVEHRELQQQWNFIATRNGVPDPHLKVIQCCKPFHSMETQIPNTYGLPGFQPAKK
jgi:phage/plasmid-associated DNA primase